MQTLRRFVIRRLSAAHIVVNCVILAPCALAGPLGPADPGTAKVGYNPATGHVIVSANAIAQWRIEDSRLIPAAAALPPGQNAAPLTGAKLIGQSARGPFNFVDFDLGPVAAPGLTPATFRGVTNTALSVPEYSTGVDALSPPGPAEPGTIKFSYNPSTGVVIVSVNAVANWYVENLGGFTGAPPFLPAAPSGVPVLTTDHDDRIGQSAFSIQPSISFTDHDLGPVLPTGLSPASIQFQFDSMAFGVRNTITAIAIPEPTTAALLLVGSLAACPRRK